MEKPDKEDFYKYGASLGIKINDLQRLAMLLKPSEHIQQEETQEYELQKKLRSVFAIYQIYNKDGSLIPLLETDIGCELFDDTVDEFNKFKLIRK